VQALLPVRVHISVHGSSLGLFLGAVVAGSLCAGLATQSQLAAMGLFASALIVGWMLTATFFTHVCGGDGLMVEAPSMLGDFYAMSRFPVCVRIANSRMRWPALFMTAELHTSTNGQTLVSPPIFLGRLDPRGTVECRWLITARMRGAFELLGVRVRLRFPGSLGAHEGDAAFTHTLLALPAVYRLDRNVLEALKERRLAVGRMRAGAASMEEFIGVRYYRPGDNPRQIHFGLSLRLSDYPHQLAIREFEDPSEDDVCVVLDNAIAPHESEDLVLRYRHEKSLSFVAALCRFLSSQKFSVRFCAVSAANARIDISVLSPTRDLSRLEAELARMNPIDDADQVLRLLEHERTRSNAAVLFVSLRNTPFEKSRPRSDVLTLTPDMQVALVKDVAAV
jgi:uncharacterized protein (DUF58 family)